MREGLRWEASGFFQELREAWFEAVGKRKEQDQVGDGAVAGLVNNVLRFSACHRG